MSEWMAIIELFLQALMECLEQRRDRQEIEIDLLSKNPRALLLRARIMRKTLRDECDLHGRDLRLAVNEGMGYLDDMDAEEISCLLDDVEAKMKLRHPVALAGA